MYRAIEHSQAFHSVVLCFESGRMNSVRITAKPRYSRVFLETDCFCSRTLEVCTWQHFEHVRLRSQPNPRVGDTLELLVSWPTTIYR